MSPLDSLVVGLLGGLWLVMVGHHKRCFDCESTLTHMIHDPHTHTHKNTNKQTHTHTPTHSHDRACMCTIDLCIFFPCIVLHFVTHINVYRCMQLTTFTPRMDVLSNQDLSLKYGRVLPYESYNMDECCHTNAIIWTSVAIRMP